MPVWHEATREARASGRLQVIGVAQEQHPERCRLFAQWKGLDWPILWDPFNTTETKVVPLTVAIDEWGVVRAVNPRPQQFEARFLDVEFEAPPGRELPPPEPSETLVGLGQAGSGGFAAAHFGALGDLLWGREERWQAAVERLGREADTRVSDGRIAFQAGVARRLRYDSGEGSPEDFQAAIDHWSRALALVPSQYIWRRRIQQYGPRTDKPYPFYTWVEEARAALLARGETPIELRAELTPAELAEPRRALPAAGAAEEPDPEGGVPDGAGFVDVEAAVAFGTARKERVASLHLAFRPRAERAVHWNNEVEPMRVWIGAGGLPEGWRVDRRLLERPLPAQATTDEVRRFSVDVELPEDFAEEGTLTGYALFHACEGVDGTCLFLRRDFEVSFAR